MRALFSIPSSPGAVLGVNNLRAQKHSACVTKPTPYSNSTHFSGHFAYHIAFPFVITWQSGSCQAQQTATTLLCTWPRAHSCDSQSHSLITFYLTCNTLLPSLLLLSSTFNLYSHSTIFSQPLLSWSSLPFATLPILWFTSLQTIPTPQLTLLSTTLCHHSHYIQHSP